MQIVSISIVAGEVEVVERVGFLYVRIIRHGLLVVGDGIARATFSQSVSTSLFCVFPPPRSYNRKTGISHCGVDNYTDNNGGGLP